MRRSSNWGNWRRLWVARRWLTSRAPSLWRILGRAVGRSGEMPWGIFLALHTTAAIRIRVFWNAACPSLLADYFAWKVLTGETQARLETSVAILKNCTDLCCCDFGCCARCTATSTWIRYLLICLALWCVGEWESGPVFSLSWLDPHSSTFKGILINADFNGYCSAFTKSCVLILIIETNGFENTLFLGFKISLVSWLPHPGLIIWFLPAVSLCEIFASIINIYAFICY